MSQTKPSSKKTLLLYAAEFSLAICLIYALFYLAGSLNLRFFVLSNRGMVEKTVSGSILSGPLDIAVWGIAIFVVLAWLGFNLAVKNVSTYRASSRAGLSALLTGIAGCVCLVLIGLLGIAFLALVSSFVIFLSIVFFKVFGISKFGLFLRLLVGSFFIILLVEVAVFFSFSAPIAMNFDPGSIGLHWNTVGLSFSNLAYPFLSYGYLLYVLLGIVCFAVSVMPAGWLSKIRVDRFLSFLASLRGTFDLENDDGFEFFRGRLVLAVAVLVGAVVSCLFVLFTVLPWANPTNMLVSVDSPDYYQWITYMHSVDVNGALSYAFTNDRTLFLILAYGLSYIASPLIVIQFVSALLIVLFGLVSLLVMRLICSLRVVWVFAALLVPFSFQALGLIYSGYFANMLALILLLAYVALFFKVLKSWSCLGFFALLSVSVFTLLSHSWTWFVFALSLIAYLFLEWRLTVHDKSLWGRFKEKCLVVSATIGVGLLVDLVRSTLSPVSSSGAVLTTVHSSLSLPNLAFLISGMQKTVELDLGGVFANGLLLSLSIIGFLTLIRVRSDVSNFLVSWIFVASVSIVFAARTFVFDRFLFLMPWVVLSSLGLFSVLRLISSRFVGRSRLLVVFVVLAFTFSIFLNYAIGYLFNINIW